MGENGCNGVRLDKYFPINLKDCNNNKKLSLYKMVNKINKKLIFASVFLYDDEGMTMTSGLFGDYNKKIFSIALDVFHMDCDKMYDFDLKTYWKK